MAPFPKVRKADDRSAPAGGAEASRRWRLFKHTMFRWTVQTVTCQIDVEPAVCRGRQPNSVTLAAAANGSCKG